jgi:hypothetical protein
MKVFPAIAINKVKIEISRDQLRMVLPFLRKKDNNPPISGIKNNNKTTI